MHAAWDNGTLRFDVTSRDASAALHLASLPGVLWDERTGCYRAPAWRLSALASVVRPPAILDLLPAPGGLEQPALRDYQAAALAAWRADPRGLVVLPTGAGKTRTALAAIAALGQPTLVLVPTRVLLAQWQAALEHAGMGPVARHGDGLRDLGPVTVATYASARLHMGRLGNRFGLLVVDECHAFGGGGGDEALELCAAPARLGLTATPPEGPRLEVLSQLIGPVRYRSTIDDLAGTWLAPYRLVTLHLSLTEVERAEHDRCMALFRPVCRAFFQGRPDAAWPDFVRAVSRSRAGRSALLAHRRARRIVADAEARFTVVADLLVQHRHERVLVFTADNAATHRVAREQLVMPITCEIGKDERAAALARFTAGELTSLVSARVLNEGVDVPCAEVAIVMAGSQGSREYVQRVGRVLRPQEGKEALVYELVVSGTTDERRWARGRERLAAP